ncbi:hypothetical protein HA402_011664 [Bradysia odoriphaga]|nr:hypothetical protein HA402_011664 [Bradysia odoriphaga]
MPPQNKQKTKSITYGLSSTLPQASPPPPQSNPGLITWYFPVTGITIGQPITATQTPINWTIPQGRHPSQPPITDFFTSLGRTVRQETPTTGTRPKQPTLIQPTIPPLLQNPDRSEVHVQYEARVHDRNQHRTVTETLTEEVRQEGQANGVTVRERIRVRTDLERRF